MGLLVIVCILVIIAMAWAGPPDDPDCGGETECGCGYA